MTVVVIAHRLTTVENCDRIYWILDGSVYKEGTSLFVLKEYKNDKQAGEITYASFNAEAD